MASEWMIYGANGYTGTLVAREAVARGLRPVLAGRGEQAVRELAGSLGLSWRAFGLGEPDAVTAGIEGMDLVLHCAGPFSATGRPMMRACVAGGSHYLDITGEIEMFEFAHRLDTQARDAGVLVCPGVGFDVVPTDCLAAVLSGEMPDAHRLALGFDSRSGVSPGTAKTMAEGLPTGGRVRREGRVIEVPLAWRTRRIDFGDGEKLAMTIPWGDVATAYYTTGIPNIEVYVPASPRLVGRMKRLNWVRGMMGIGPVQRLMKRRIEASVSGPSDTEREQADTYVWGEVENPAGERRTGRVRTANGYSVTVSASLGIVAHVLESEEEIAGHLTPARIMGGRYVETLPGSGRIEIE